MTSPSPNPAAIDTLGKLADAEMGLVWYCDDCNRRMELTLVRAIEIWGRDQVFIRWRPPIKCGGCGSRSVNCRVQANTAIGQPTGKPFSRP
ncbi:hypothetical protein VQ042_01395 [Aurantimonas sp. A2-1-M11]|uniref:hypothetical protein n=1 Tax=Aurantimonas sp. A2-1-M11 TaxID=3113712 RepID=UPI002F94EA58